MCDADPVQINHQYLVDDCIFTTSGWVAVVITTCEDADKFPIKVGDTLESGHKVLETSLFSLPFTWQSINRRSVALLLDEKIEKGTTLCVSKNTPLATNT
jgi:hypothetical protein